MLTLNELESDIVLKSLRKNLLDYMDTYLVTVSDVVKQRVRNMFSLYSKIGLESGLLLQKDLDDLKEQLKHGYVFVE